ncbi:MAG: DNA polymerase III subunit gamma/tau [Clostridia bacterium]|nr:DNA polymerase III subunit gamma/tau [Clostridia bacterium]
MSYLALYRQFRPKTFEEIIGQEHVVKTLINQINTDRVGHAYLFCGARGTGKTTAAKVFARAINCTSPKNGSPCGECEACKKLENSSNLDILEMDAASNNKVEHVRDIRDKIQYPPVAGKYKVYIIDEVHMLTPEAFNALLKTLEEPPAHAVFILATTEVHKIPATILSRCLRFDFKLISTQQIASFICSIYDKVGKKYQKEAVTLIAKAGEGSVRDALSIADICLSYSNTELTYDDVLEVLGTSDRAVIEDIINAMSKGETGEMLSLIDKLCMRGKSISILNRDVCTALRDISVIKTCKNAGEILSLPQDKLLELKKIADNTSVQSVLRSIEIFSTAEADLKYSTHPKIVFETAAVKASLPQADYNIDALMSRMSALESKIEKGEFTVKSVTKVVETTKVEQSEQPSIKEQQSLSPIKVIEKADKVVEKSEEITKPNALKSEPMVDTVESKKQSTKADDYDEDLASLMASYDGSADDDYNENQFSFMDDFSAVSKPAKKVETKSEEPKRANGKQEQETVKPVEKLANSAINATKDCTMVWGALLRKLRADKEIMLWVACQDVTVKVSGNYILVIAPGENEYDLLSRQENVNKLSLYLTSEGFDGVKIVKDENAEIEEQKSDESTDQVKQYFEGEIINIK